MPAFRHSVLVAAEVGRTVTHLKGDQIRVRDGLNIINFSRPRTQDIPDDVFVERASPCYAEHLVEL